MNFGTILLVLLLSCRLCRRLVESRLRLMPARSSTSRALSTTRSSRASEERPGAARPLWSCRQGTVHICSSRPSRTSPSSHPGEEERRRLGRSDRAVLLGPADAGRAGPGRLYRGGQQQLLPAVARHERGRRPPPRPKAVSRPLRQCPLDAGHLFQAPGVRLRIPPSAGSGSGEAPNPVGYNRVYVHLDGDFSYQSWWKNFRAAGSL